MKKYLFFLFIPWYLLAQSITSQADLAYNIHVRVAGAAPSNQVLIQMINHLNNGDPIAAGMLATNHPGFADSLVPWVNRWMNEESDPQIPLNDATATLVGIIIRDQDWRLALYGDILYTIDLDLVSFNNEYSNENNTHYNNAHNQRIDLLETLVENTQSSVTGIPSSATAGILTTRQFASVFYNAGTNRAPNFYLFQNFLCTHYENIKDFEAPQDFIGVDVERAPGGSAQTFLTDCKGCHTIQDAARGAYAYYDWDEGNNRMMYTPGQVRPKYTAIIEEPGGYMTPNDQWVNYFAMFNNASMGWDGGLGYSGNGVKAWGLQLAHSEAYASCAAQKAFELACYRSPSSSADQTKIQGLTQYFKEQNFNMKKLIVNAATWCAEDSLQ